MTGKHQKATGLLIVLALALIIGTSLNAWAVTTVGDGTNPPDITIGPGAPAIMLNAFTLQTDTGSDNVTQVSVTFPGGSSLLDLIEITSDSGAVVHGSKSNPSGNPVGINITNNITATTTQTQYKIRITPDSHDNMPPPPGGEYSMFGIVVPIQSTQDRTYDDTNSATIVIDNLSPSNVVWGAITTGDEQIELNWNNPGDPDFDEVVILRHSSSISDTPVEGVSYAQGNTIGSSTVRYVGSLETFTDTSVTNLQQCYYKVFACESNGNYSANGVGSGPYAPREIALTTNSLRFGVDVTSQMRGTDCSGQSALSAGDVVGTFFDDISASVGKRVQLDALLVYSNQIVFSLDVDCIIDSVTYRDEDLIAYDANATTFSMFLDGSAVDILASEDIDAACFEYGTTNLLLSFDTTVTLPGPLTVDDDDIVRYAAGVFTKLYDGQADLGIPESADVNALHDGELCLYVSLNKTVTFSVPGADEDIWYFDTVSSNMTLISDLGLEPRVDLQCLDQPLDSDGDWLTDFEEASGVDEAASTYPGTATVLDPGGNTSDPNVADTDNDGISDGGEAACGTDPDNSGEVLEFVDTTVQSGTNIVVIWQSVEGKTYALDSSDDLIAGLTNELVGSYPAAAGTNVTVYTNYDATVDDVRFYRVRLVVP